MKGCWVLSNAFSVCIEMIIFRYVCIYVCMYSSFSVCIDFYMLNHTCLVRVNPTWSWCTIFLMCCWIQFGGILLRTFAFVFTKGYWSVIFFSCSVIVWIWCQSMLALYAFGSVSSSSFFFWRSLKWIGINSALNIWYSSPWNHLVLGICWEIFDSWLIFISLVCLDFLFLCDSGLVGCLFLGIYPFLPGYPTHW